jgi:hypothetical protein
MHYVTRIFQFACGKYAAFDESGTGDFIEVAILGARVIGTHPA